MIKNGRYQFTEDCDRVAETLRRIGDKWSVLIIVLVELGPRRFNDLKRSIPGISRLVLLRSQPALRVRAIPRADMNYVSRCRLRKQELSGALVDRAALLLALLWTDSLATWPCPAEADARPLA